MGFWGAVGRGASSLWSKAKSAGSALWKHKNTIAAGAALAGTAALGAAAAYHAPAVLEEARVRKSQLDKMTDRAEQFAHTMQNPQELGAAIGNMVYEGGVNAAQYGASVAGAALHQGATRVKTGLTNVGNAAAQKTKNASLATVDYARQTGQNIMNNDTMVYGANAAKNTALQTLKPLDTHHMPVLPGSRITPNDIVGKFKYHEHIEPDDDNDGIWEQPVSGGWMVHDHSSSHQNPVDHDDEFFDAEG